MRQDIKVRGWNTRTIVGPLFSSITQGFMDNVFDQCTACRPTIAAVEAGFFAEGSPANDVGCSRDHFRLFEFAIGGDTGTRAIFLGMVDNNTFDRVFNFFSTGVTDGKGAYLNHSGLTGAETLFSHENLFLNCLLLGGVVGASVTGGNLPVGYPTSDGASVLTISNVRGIRFDGEPLGTWAGSVVSWSAKVDPVAGLGADATTKYVAPIAMAASQPDRFSSELPVHSGQRLVRVRTNLGVAPGRSATRILTIHKDGVNQAASIF